jgi:hypothetical protein
VRRRSKAPSAASAPSARSTAIAGRKARGLFGAACLCVLGLTAFLGSSASSVGAAESFPGQGFLPHNRAWEMVSPVEKNGGGVAGDPARTRAAVDGSAVTFISLTPFGDIEGTGVASEYLARRSTDPDPGNGGWSTHGITPRHEVQTFLTAGAKGEPRYEGVLSPDLSKGVYMAWGPLTDAPKVADVQNLYLRDDLLEPGPGSYQLLSDCPVCVEKLSGIRSAPSAPSLAGTSADFSHVIFESTTNRAEGATGSNAKLYEFDNGTVRFVGVLPNGTNAPRSIAGLGVFLGSGFKYTLNPISTDGSRIAFTQPPNNSSKLGKLFSRINGRTTVQLNASERNIPVAEGQAQYWDASADHSRVFFMSGEPLTDDAVGLTKLYMWERADHDEVQQVAVDATGGDFTLTFNTKPSGSFTTEPIPYGASAASVQSALEELVGGPQLKPIVGVGNVSVSGGPSTYQVSFGGDFAGTNVAEMSADGSGLSGGAATATVSTTTPVENLSFLSVDEEPVGGEGVNVIGVLGASRDGKRAYFVANGQAVAGAPTSIATGLYLWHEGEISYIGELSDFGADSGDMFTGEGSITLNRRQTRVTPDGRHLIFRSRSGQGLLSAHGQSDAEHKNLEQLYLYSADTDELTCVSCRPDGAPSTAEANDYVRVATGGSMTSRYENHPLSDDGRYVFFSTAEKLVPEDSNGAADAYVYDSVDGEPRLLSSGENRNGSYFLDASPSGKDAFFMTREPLSGWDVDDAYDLYDARVEGGFPEPPPPPPSCQGDACQPAPTVLNDPTPASSSSTGSGNPNLRKPKPRCAKGKQRVKARNGKSRCVRKQSKKSNKRTKTNRRAGR